jgi:hypothetical protein
MTNLLKEIMNNYLTNPEFRRKNVDWTEIEKEWLCCSTNKSLNRDILKSKWQTIKNKLPNSMSSSSSLLSSHHLSIDLPLISSSSILPAAKATQRVINAGESSVTTNRHVLDSENYDLVTISNVTLKQAPPKTKFTPSELDVFQYVLKKKMKWDGGTIKWKIFEHHWTQVAKVAKLNSAKAEVYLRTSCMLEEKWKSTEKSKHTKI